MNPKIKKRCQRVHLINLLEEEELCKMCNYCKFLIRLKDVLIEKKFFTTDAHIDLWDIKYIDGKLTATPVL